MILTYELSDDLGTEHEAEFANEQEAFTFIHARESNIVWFELVDDEGKEIEFSIAY